MIVMIANTMDSFRRPSRLTINKYPKVTLRLAMPIHMHHTVATRIMLLCGTLACSNMVNKTSKIKVPQAREVLVCDLDICHSMCDSNE